MQEETFTGDEISLVGIFQALIRKLWIIVAAIIFGAVLGGAFGYLRYHGKYYYGTNLEYYISLKAKHELALFSVTTTQIICGLLIMVCCSTCW